MEMSNINDKIKQLLEDNRKYFEGEPIVFDGVIDEEEFRKSKLKTVFLLKEVNNLEMQEDWVDFTDDVKKETEKNTLYSTWPNICLWMKVLNDSNAQYIDTLDEHGDFATKKLQKNLLQIAVVNIKKHLVVEKVIIVKLMMQCRNMAM